MKMEQTNNKHYCR